MKCTALILLGSSWLRIIWTRKRIDTVPHQNIVFHGVLKQIPWATFDRLVTEHNADWDERVVKTRAHLIAMLLAQFCGARSLREIETNLKSHAGKLYHLGGDAVSRSALSSANASRPAEFFADLLAALMKSLQAGYRRKIGDCVRLVDSTSVQLSNLSGHWATFSAGVCGAKAQHRLRSRCRPAALSHGDAFQRQRHHGRQADAHRGGRDLRFRPRLLRLRLVGDARPGGLPDRHAAQIQHPLQDRGGSAGGAGVLDPERSDRIPPRAARRVAPQPDAGSRARSSGRDRDRQGAAHLHTASAQEITDLYKRRWAIELFFRWVKQTL